MQIEHGIPQYSNKVQIGLVRTPIQLASFYELWLVYIGCKQQQQQPKTHFINVYLQFVTC